MEEIIVEILAELRNLNEQVYAVTKMSGPDLLLDIARAKKMPEKVSDGTKISVPDILSMFEKTNKDTAKAMQDNARQNLKRRLDSSDEFVVFDDAIIPKSNIAAISKIEHSEEEGITRANVRCVDGSYYTVGVKTPVVKKILVNLADMTACEGE